MTIRQAMICELRKNGMTIAQIADEAKCSFDYVKQVCSENGIRILQKCNPLKIVDEHLPQFEYVGGFANCDGSVNIRCKVCGHVQSRSLITIRHNRKTECENCKRIESERREQERKKDQEARKAYKAHLREASKKAKQLSFSVCKSCGCLFFSERAGAMYCSQTCMKRESNALKKDRRIRKLRSIVVDKGINIERLYEKSNGVCALCGGKCNLADHVIRDDGSFVVGATYPSIDHIKPISKGGLHEWSNVQLAHHVCNSKKHNNG